MQKITLQHITHKQQQILFHIYKFRFLNRCQIQTLLNHKDPKRINQWLKDLNQKEYITRIYSTKKGESIKPAIYYINLNGIKFLNTQNYSKEIIKKLYRENERTNNFIEKCIITADIYLDFLSQNNHKITYEVFTLTDITKPSNDFNILEELSPTLFINKKTGSLNQYYILEIFDINSPAYAVKKRIKNYFDYYFKNIWEEKIKEDFPIILCICANTAQLINSKRITKKLFDNYQNPDSLHFRFAIAEEINKNGITNEIWEEIN